jgi:hypothetical protein
MSELHQALLETIIEQQYVNSMSDFVTNLLEEYEMMGF